MKIPAIEGIIRRRLLLNYRVDPGVMQRLLPAPFRAKLHRGHAIAGLCLIRLEHVRPNGFPATIGISSENAAHRVAIEWSPPQGEARSGVFVRRRDTNSTLNHLAGGRIFPGVHHRAHFNIDDDGAHIDFAMDSHDGAASIRVKGDAAGALPATSCFASLAESSRFFEDGRDGYSPGRDGCGCDGLRLEITHWTAQPFAVNRIEASWFSELNRQFPGAAEFDHALIMRDIPHRWKNLEPLP